MPRVIAGKARGRALKTPAGQSVRPTTDRVKESVFNIINPLLADCVFVDLFAGSGSIGIEALSRGAGVCHFCDDDAQAMATVKSNLTSTGLMSSSVILTLGDYRSVIARLSREGTMADIVYCDPPYSTGAAAEVLVTLGDGEALSGDSIVLIEHHRDETLPISIGQLSRYRQKEYGTIVVSFYRNQRMKPGERGEKL